MSNIKEAMNGDKQAFINVIEEYKVSIYKTAKAILKDEDDTCDAMQEAWICIYRNIGELKNEKYFKTWAIRITINEWYHIIKKQKLNQEKTKKAETQIESSKNEYQLSIDKTEMEIALNKLEEELRIVIVLYYYNDLSTKDIANILDIPKGTVQSRLQRARDNLYNILKEEEGEF